MLFIGSMTLGIYIFDPILRILLNNYYQMNVAEHMPSALVYVGWIIISFSGGKFKEHITFGMLTASLYSTFAGMYIPGEYSLIHSFDELSFLQPVF